MVDHELNELKREFLVEARDKVNEMRSALDSASAESLERVAYLAHQLKGSGGSYGYQRISADAAAIEKALESDGRGSNGAIREHVVSLQTEIDRCVGELSA